MIDIEELGVLIFFSDFFVLNEKILYFEFLFVFYNFILRFSRVSVYQGMNNYNFCVVV